MTSNSAEVDDDSTVRTFGMLSTFPPTACGIATFAAALSAGLVANGAAVDVVRCGSDEVLEDPLVVAALGNGSARDGPSASTPQFDRRGDHPTRVWDLRRARR
jgi:hypothetical protein